MTKKDFALVASVLNDLKDLHEIDRVINRLSRAFRETYPKYDATKFVAACHASIIKGDTNV